MHLFAVRSRLRSVFNNFQGLNFNNFTRLQAMITKEWKYFCPNPNAYATRNFVAISEETKVAVCQNLCKNKSNLQNYD